MNFADIKTDREFIELTPKQVDWLISEVERLQHSWDRTDKRKATHVKDTATRCAEIAEKMFQGGHAKDEPDGNDIAKAIRKEFL